MLQIKEENSEQNRMRGKDDEFHVGCKECEIIDNSIVYNLSEEEKKVYEKNSFDITFPISKLKQIF